MSKRAEAVRLAKSGVRPKRIAQKLNMHPGTVYAAIRRARLEGENIPEFSKSRLADQPTAEVHDAQSVTVPLRLHSLLATEAERRGMTNTELAQRLLEDALLLKGVRHG